ncbi:MAG: radical SAM protein [Clostridia bacterium]|nr:radical SAM protein [Clostridia bacterium]
MKCNLCPRQCNADRENSLGFCKSPLSPKVARANLHFWEEPIISGQNGSGTVFFSGCSLKCIYCQNYEISQGSIGKEISVDRLAEIFKELEHRGAHNINLVSPTHYILAIIEALKIYRPKIPIVYNSSGYETVEALKKLENFIDIYLIDFKYTDSERAGEYSFAPDYPETAKKAIAECYRQKRDCIIENGIMKKGVIVRHLVLPQNTKTALEVADWVKQNTPNAYFSIMSQYLPCADAVNHKILGRKITQREYDKVVNYICDIGLKNVFIQEMGSSNKAFVPDFDLSGV